MAATPKKLVHWALEYSKSPLASPSSDTSTLADSSSTLQYVNAQLCAHGFASSPGLSLDGLSAASSEKVVKCLFSMLSQRVEDMSRTEELTTKLRTLSYDHERLLSMHKSALETAASAEREASTLKSKITNASRALVQSESAHKHTTSELQRTRSAMQSLRATHSAEIKKKEKEVERIAERWSKLSDSQMKLGNTRSGITMTCANVQALEGREVGKGLVDAALEEAEEACRRLREENTEVKALTVDVANAVQKILHKATSQDPDNLDYPELLENAEIFGLGPTDAAFEKLSSLLTSLRNAVADLRSDEPRLTAETNPSTQSSTATQTSPYVQQLQKTITSLRSELDKAQQESRVQAAKAQTLFDQIAASAPQLQRDAAELATSRDELDHLRAELQDQQKTFDEAAVSLGRDRAALESDRLDFLEKKRAWQLERLLDPEPSKLPSTGASPQAQLGPLPEEYFPPTTRPRSPSPQKSPRKHKVKQLSPRKSPAKSVRPGRRTVAPGKLSFAPAYETEVIPGPSSSLMPTTFALPPPSPQSKLPPRNGPLVPESDAGPSTSAKQQLHDLFAKQSSETAPLAPSTTPPFDPPGALSESEDLKIASQANPAHPFPVAKPFATRMIHAYSPVKPSPLSRILMLADSPESAPKLPAAFPIGPLTASHFSLSSHGDDDSPLCDKAIQDSTKHIPGESARVPADRKGKRTLAASVNIEEKENTIKRKLKGPAHKSRPPAASSAATAKTKPRSTSSAPKASVSGRPGPRRVPASSAEAGWRGRE